MIAENLIVEKGVSAGDAWVTVAPGDIRTAMATLKADGFRTLTFLTCVDHLADSSQEWPARYEIVYQLRNLETREQLRVRAFVAGDPPRIDTVQPLRRDYPVGGEVVEFSEEHETWQTAPEDA